VRFSIIMGLMIAIAFVLGMLIGLYFDFDQLSLGN
jgi:hypothetical protein